MSEIISFPSETGPCINTPAFLSERGFFLRPAQDADIPRLRVLYANTRAEEMAGVPWPLQLTQNFLDKQFDLQRRHYLEHYGDADFLVIEHDKVLLGRYYLLRTAPAHLIIDICLMAGQCGQGVGRAIIEASQREALAMQRGMHLHVLKVNNRAQALYVKLGFEFSGGTDTHHYMQWHGG